MKKWHVGILIVVVAASTLAASSAALAQESLQLVLTDYAFTPNRFVLQSGKTYQLTLVNRGTVEHEFMAGRQMMMGGEEEHGYMQNFFEGIEVLVQFEGGAVEVDELVEVEVEPGHQVTLTFTVPDGKRGEWEIACFVSGHYELGMHGALTVR